MDYLDYFYDHAPIFASMVYEYLNGVRRSVNDSCLSLEPWQVISYTLSFSCLVLWSRTLLQRSDKPFTVQLKLMVFHWIRKLPWVQQKIAAELEKVHKEMEENMHKMDLRREFYKFLPDKGLDVESVLLEAESYAKMGEFDYKKGRVSGAVYTDLSGEHKALLTQVFELYAYTNPLHPDVFPCVRKMEAEVVRMICNLFHGGSSSCGTVTTGGTESILLACLAHRNRAYAHGNYAPEMVVPVTAHAAFEKAADLFRMRIRHVPVNKNTMQLGRRHKIPVHVDACLGGFLLPFMERCDYTVKAFDFRLPGVASISCDTHKYGFTPKGTSVIMYREKKYLHHQYFCVTDWPGGIYASPTLGGSRAGANIALCWATLLHFGLHGYMEATQKIIEATQLIKEGLEEIDTIRIVGSVDVSVVAFNSDAFNILNFADFMSKRGWNLNILQHPPCVHLCVTVNHTKEGVVQKFLDDSKEISMELLNNPIANDATKTAAIYGMAASVVDRSVVKEVATLYLDSTYSLPSTGRESRKVSVSRIGGPNMRS